MPSVTRYKGLKLARAMANLRTIRVGEVLLTRSGNDQVKNQIRVTDETTNIDN